MRNSTYFGSTGLDQTKPVIDPQPAVNRFEPQQSSLLRSILKIIHNVVDVKLSELIPAIQNYQTNYLTANNRYWQGILTPQTLPQDGGEIAPNLALKPTDQTEDWAAADLGLPATLPMSIEIHTHNGPLGKGYSVIVNVFVLGNRFQSAQGFGFHSFTVPWVQLSV
jgi:hypothetical protein